MVSANALEADSRNASTTHLETAFRKAGLGLKANETMRMLIGGNSDQEWRGHGHAGYEVDAAGHDEGSESSEDWYSVD